MRSVASALPTLLSALLLAACAPGGGGGGGDPAHGSDELRITEPAPDAVLASPLVHVVGTTTLEGADPVLVNGQELAVEGGRFEGTIEMSEGAGRITASRDGFDAWVDVVVDTQAPAIVIDSPEPGSFVDGEVLRVRGHVTDTTLESFVAGDVAIEVAEDGSFAADLDTGVGAQRVRFLARDRAGHESRAYTTALLGHFENDQYARPDALVFELGRTTLDTLGRAVTPYLRSDRLEPMLLAENPVSTGFWGELDIDSETHSEPSFVLTPRDGRLDVVVTIPNVRIPLTAPLSIGPTLTGELTCTRAVLSASAVLSAESGRPVVTLTGVDVTLEGLLIDVHGLWSWIDENVVTRAARGVLEAKLIALVEEEVPVRLADALAGLDDLRSLEVADGLALVRFEPLRALGRAERHPRGARHVDCCNRA